MANMSMSMGLAAPGAPLEAEAAPVSINGGTAPTPTPTQSQTSTLEASTSTASPLSPSGPSSAAAAAEPSAVPLKLDLPEPQVFNSAHPQPNEPPSATTAQNSDDNEDDPIYNDQDGAQSFIQPAISARATRLTSANTPAAEKAAAMDYLPSLFDFPDDGGRGGRSSGNTSGEPSPPMSPRKSTRRGHFRQSSHSGLPDLPTPWRAEPKQMVVGQPHGAKTSSMFGVFGSETRSSRAASSGENALKKLSKALPSISIPTPSFFSSGSSSSSHKESTWPIPHLPKSATIAGIRSNRAQTGPSLTTPGEATTQGPVRSSSLRASRPPTLRHSTSDDSLLYQSLTRVSSLGDDERFADVREQVNTRIKAIIDSFEPSFNLPKLPKSTSFTRLMAVSRGRLTEAGITSPLKKVVPSGLDSHGTDATRSAPGPSSHRPSREFVHPLDAALETLTGDIVVMGGYRGSILRSAEPPYRQLWVPVKVGLNIRKVNMEVGLEPEDEENMEKHIFASGMLQNIGPVDISRKLFRKLRECENARNGKLRVHDYGYDWRLSPARLSKKLNDFLATLPSNQPHVPAEQRGAWVIAHSLGGLITRHAVNQRPDLFAGVVYAGVPQRCINILGPLRNGDAVLLNEKVLTAQVNFSLRTTFVFLPEDGFCFIDKNTKEEYPVDFYNVDDWLKYRLSPCVGEPALPPLNPSKNTGALGSLLSLSDSFSNLSNLPLRGRSNSGKNRDDNNTNTNSTTHKATTYLHNHNPFSSSSSPTSSSPNPVLKDRTLAPQMGSSSSDTPEAQQQQQAAQMNRTPSSHSQALAYLKRTLAETKQFRAELAHNPSHQRRNAYPPLSVIYAKDIPTVHAARVSCRDAIACTDAYDDLVFASGDGVVLARESMLPEGYELVKDGRVCTDRGHVSMLGDLVAVGKALEAVVRGRRKGIGRGAVVDESEGEGVVGEAVEAGQKVVEAVEGAGEKVEEGVLEVKKAAKEAFVNLMRRRWWFKHGRC
ncbi:hypothetical protein B0T20DRAFT_456160 [Sordaria brevicollis]|uniref:Uncharacterized protein n=1 Tax=Sordaria brevicollis TaxID=83679 RepID=A0AAE0P2B4_SORBR|nr:hypothetical protein B0T20DRAFT_456160 [Sordaria brevicollis]